MPSDRSLTNILRQAGLDLMTRAGHRPSRVPRQRGALIYRREDGSTFRLRTCHKHSCITVVDLRHDPPRFNTAGTDYVVFVMPDIPRAYGPVQAYLVPTEKVTEQEMLRLLPWLDNPRRGDRFVWAGRFNQEDPESLAYLWARYRIPSAGGPLRFPEPADDAA